jgi:integrase/recombinase XerD
MAGAPSGDLDTRVESWLASLHSDNTRAAYRRDLVVFLAWLQSVQVPPRRVTVAHVERFAHHLDDEGSSDATVRRRMAAVASFYRHAGPAWSMANPATEADRPAAAPDVPAVVLTPAEASAVCKAANELGPKTAVVVGFVLLDGFKSHELLKLDAADLRRVGNAYSVVDDDAPGGAAPAPLDPRTSAALRRYVGSRRAGPLLLGDNPTRTPARLTRYGVDYLVRRAAERSGVSTPISVNVLRNTQAAGRTAMAVHPDDQHANGCR